jgi:hypothetical protein
LVDINIWHAYSHTLDLFKVGDEEGGFGFDNDMGCEFMFQLTRYMFSL